jgi:hypothetical protein
MIHAANTVTYNMPNDDERLNKEMASDSLELNVVQPPSNNSGVLLLASKVAKVCGMHIG